MVMFNKLRSHRNVCWMWPQERTPNWVCLINPLEPHSHHMHFKLKGTKNYLHTWHNMICTKFLYTRSLVTGWGKTTFCYLPSCGFDEVHIQGTLLQPIAGRHLCNIERNAHHVKEDFFAMVFTNHTCVQWKHDMSTRFEIVSAMRNWEVGIPGCETLAIASHSWPIKTWGHIDQLIRRSF